MKYVLKVTRFIHKQAVALHVAALNKEVRSRRRYAHRLSGAAVELNEKSLETSRRYATLQTAAFEAHKQADIVRSVAEGEAARIGGRLDGQL